MEDVQQVEARILDTVRLAEKEVDKKLESANALLTEIKSAMAKGTDCIPLITLQEWAVAIPIICDELVSQKEAFNLVKSLWDIESKQMQAANLLELDEKKTKIEIINKQAGTPYSKNRAIAEYLGNRIAGTQEALWCLSIALRKIIDSRNIGGAQ